MSSPAKISRVLVGVDFDEASASALKMAGVHEIDRLFFARCGMKPAWRSFDFAIDIMTALNRFSILGAAALLMLAAVSIAMAQTTSSGQQGSPMYDVKTETRLRSTWDQRPTSPRKGARLRKATCWRSSVLESPSTRNLSSSRSR